MNPMLRKMAEAFQADLRDQGKLFEFDRAHPDPQRLMMYTGEAADLPRALRAALLAIREPDDATLNRGTVYVDSPLLAQAAWNNMIDAILNEKPEETA